MPLPGEGFANFTLDCNLDALDGQPLGAETIEISKSKPHTFGGWLVNPALSTAGDEVKLVIQGVGDVSDVWTADKVRRISYPDIVKARGYKDTMTDSGFAFDDLQLGELSNGTYHVFVTFANPPTGAICDPGRQVRVAD